MFKNMKIGMRLGLGFGLVLILLGVVAFLGITRMAALNDSVEDMTKNKWPKVVLLETGLAGVNEIGIATRDMVLAETKESRQQAKERILSGRAVIGKAWETHAESAQGVEMMNQILESRSVSSGRRTRQSSWPKKTRGQKRGHSSRRITGGLPRSIANASTP